jgi:hypothetical protein
VTIIPDTKDWTWVLQRPCPECGLDTSSFPREAVGGMVVANAIAWRNVLTSPGDIRVRAEPGRWSVLEYGCHVRDVLRLYDYRLGLILTENHPLFPNWDQDGTAVADRYGEQQPLIVAAELSQAAEVIAARFATVTGDMWQRRGQRGDGAVFTTDSFARYFIHDPIHHLYDATGVRWSGGGQP